MIESLADRFMLHVACSVAVLSVVAGHGDADAADMFVANHSFEAVDTLPVSGIWPEADIDPVNANFWLEPGPVDETLNAFPPALIPPGFAPPAGATLDTGIFFNAPVNQDPDTGQFVTNPSFVINADGDQLAYLFAKDDLQPNLGFIQQTAAVYQDGDVYAMTAAVGKSFFVPPVGGSQGDPTLALRLLYVDAFETMHVVHEMAVAASVVQSTLLSDFSVIAPAARVGDPWLGRPIALAIRPLDGDSGVWIFDDVRLATVPEPAAVFTGTLLLGMGWRHFRRERRHAVTRVCRA